MPITQQSTKEFKYPLIPLKWDDIDGYISNIINQIKEKGISPTGVYGIPRGGLIPATILAYKLNIPLLMAPINNCIIIDDDTSTFRAFEPYIPGVHQSLKFYLTVMIYNSYGKKNTLLDLIGHECRSNPTSSVQIYPWDNVTFESAPWLFKDDIDE